MFPEDVVARYVYNSNRLDGVSLTEEQTLGILNGSIQKTEETTELAGSDGKEWDIESVLSHKRALEKIGTVAAEASVPFSEDLILDLHKVLMGEILLAAGEYRECTLKYKGLLIASPPETLKARTASLIELANKGVERTDKKDQLAWRVHHEFITIHPFIEANGRMARLLMNLIRLRAGLDLAIVRFEDREKYSKAILEFQQHKIAKVQEQQKQAGAAAPAARPANLNASASGTQAALPIVNELNLDP
jgi:Fic family protein